MGSSASASKSKSSASKSAVFNRVVSSAMTWNKRWFVFDRNKRTVMYFSDKQESKVKGGIYFQVRNNVQSDSIYILCTITQSQ